MSENRNLSTKVLQMYEEIQEMKEIVSGLMSLKQDFVTNANKDKLRQLFLNTDWKFLPGIKDDRYNRLYLLSMTDKDITSLGQELLDELNEALSLFDIPKNKTDVLSDRQQLILATLYLSGIRGIAYQEDNFALYHKGGFFAGNMEFIENSDVFDFSVLEKYMKPRQIYYLSNIIETLCPEYAYVLKT